MQDMYQRIKTLYESSFMDLLHQAQTIHRTHFNPNEIECATLLSIKTGRCPEDCAYCPQSAHYDTGLTPEKLLSLEEVKQHARAAKAMGSTRFCMGAAWKYPNRKDFPQVLEMIKAVKEEGLEACVTLGALTEEQALQMKAAGLDFYNHNIDTSPEHYKKIISTRDFEERINTLEHVANAGLSTCCGGIVGMGETREDRIQFFMALLALKTRPTSIPINQLIRIKGTPLEHADSLDVFEFIRTIAIARILFPQSVVRLSAGREAMSDEMQALCFYAGANSIFLGNTLLVTQNPSEDHDYQLLKTLGMQSKMNVHENAC